MIQVDYITSAWDTAKKYLAYTSEMKVKNEAVLYSAVALMCACVIGDAIRGEK